MPASFVQKARKNAAVCESLGRASHGTGIRDDTTHNSTHISDHKAKQVMYNGIETA